MKSYDVIRVHGKPNWDTIPVAPIDEYLWSDVRSIVPSAQLAWDEDALYVRLQAIEPKILRRFTGTLDEVCKDSCLEFFFCPAGGDRYFNFEWNPAGGLYLGLRSGHELYVRLQPEDPVALFEYRSQRTDDGWEIFYKIPLSFINLIFPEFQLASGTAFRANCFKCGDRTVQPHYLSWNPCTSDYPRFHLVSDFGRMILE